MIRQPELMPTPISQAEVNAILWKACDTFRGTVDPSEYKNYILVMLFVKYVSDVWHDHRAQYEREFAGDAARVERRLSREPFKLPQGADFASLYAARNQDNIGEQINKALEAIEDANKAKLENVFRNIDFNSEANLGRTPERNQRLRNLLDDFADPRLDLRPSHIGDANIVGNAYEYLTRQFAAVSGKAASDFYTPQEISMLLARLLAPQSGERIYDPACGTGSLLINCAREVGSDSYSVWGQEINGSTWAQCMINMLLHNVTNISTQNIRWGDTLRNPLHLQNSQLMQFDVVVSNPPYSLTWDAELAHYDPYHRFERGVPPRNNGDYAFISHAVASLHSGANSTARAGLIVPQGVLFRGGKEAAIRQKLIEDNKLDAVIGLPANLFFGIGIPAAILIFKETRQPDTPVLFIDASHDFELNRGINRLRNEDIDRIVSTYKSRDSILGFSRAVDLTTIALNDYNLNISRYIAQAIASDSKTGFATAWPGKHEIFLSYSRKNAETMNIIDNFLSDYGLRVWADHSIEQGTVSWQQTIEAAIEDAFCMVVLLSPASKASEWVLKEISFAQIHKKPIFPILIEGDLQSSLPFALAGAQHTFFDSTDARNQNSNLRELAETVLSKIGIIEHDIFYRVDWQSIVATRGWRVSKLDQCSQILRGRSLQNNNLNKGEYPVYSPKGEILWHTSEFSFDGDYILFSTIGDQGCMVKRISGRFATTGNLFVLKPLDDVLHIDFLMYVLRIMRFDHLLQGNVMRSIPVSDLRNTLIPVPPLETQIEIVEYIQEQIQVTELAQSRLQTRLEILISRPRGVIYQALTQELNP